MARPACTSRWNRAGSDHNRSQPNVGNWPSRQSTFFGSTVTNGALRTWLDLQLVPGRELPKGDVGPASVFHKTETLEWARLYPGVTRSGGGHGSSISITILFCCCACCWGRLDFGAATGQCRRRENRSARVPDLDRRFRWNAETAANPHHRSLQQDDLLHRQ